MSKNWPLKTLKILKFFIFFCININSEENIQLKIFGMLEKFSTLNPLNDPNSFTINYFFHPDVFSEENLKTFNKIDDFALDPKKNKNKLFFDFISFLNLDKRKSGRAIIVFPKNKDFQITHPSLPRDKETIGKFFKFFSKKETAFGCLPFTPDGGDGYACGISSCFSNYSAVYAYHDYPTWLAYFFIAQLFNAKIYFIGNLILFMDGEIEKRESIFTRIMPKEVTRKHFLEILPDLKNADFEKRKKGERALIEIGLQAFSLIEEYLVSTKNSDPMVRQILLKVKRIFVLNPISEIEEFFPENFLEQQISIEMPKISKDFIFSIFEKKNLKIKAKPKILDKKVHLVGKNIPTRDVINGFLILTETIIQYKDGLFFLLPIEELL